MPELFLTLFRGRPIVLIARTLFSVNTWVEIASCVLGHAARGRRQLWNVFAIERWLLFSLMRSFLEGRRQPEQEPY